MRSATNFFSAALKTAISLVLTGVFLSGGAFSSPPNRAKHPAASTESKRLKSKSSQAVVSASRRGLKTQAASNGTARARTRKVVVTRKRVNGRWVRVTQVVRRPQGPSYQPHPDTERYQQIQQALSANGYYKGEVNGQWNDDSVAALKQFQTDRQIPNDGRISSLSLIGLGLGPNRPAATGSAPAPAAPASN